MALIPQDPKQRNALIVGLVAVAGFYFFWSYWYSPRKTEVDEMTTRLEELETENRRAQIIATRGGADLQERLALYERHVAKLEQLIPQSEEVPSLLADMGEEARRAGVELFAVRPEPPEPGAFYTKRSYEVEVVGEYHDIGRFLAAVGSLPRIITPVDLELAPFSGATELLDMDAPLTAKFRIQTYIVPSGEGTQTAGAEGGPGE